jgi:hypothetical protein
MDYSMAADHRDAVRRHLYDRPDAG